MQKKILPVIIIFQVLAFIGLIFYKSIGSLPGYELLGQIALADRITMGLELYPSPNSHELWGTSVYFPGVAFLTAILLEIIPSSSIVNIMYFIAFLITFLVIFIQKYIVFSMYENYKPSNFWPVIIIIVLTVSYHWLSYSSVFKPDSIAYLIGATSLLAHEKNKKNLALGFFLGLVAGSALIFKQQYIAFVIGYLIYSLVTRNKEDATFSFGIFLSSLFIFLYVIKDKSMYFWTVGIFYDDSYYTIIEWFRSQLKLIIISLVALAGVFTLHYFGRLNLNTKQFFSLLPFSIKKPFFWIIIFCSISAFSSSWIKGGNSGNTGLSIFLLSPLFLIIFENSNRKILLAISVLVTAIHLSSIVRLQANIEQVSEFRNQAENVTDKQCSGLVVGTNVYYAIRDNYLGCDYQNYWTHSLRNNSYPEDELRNLVSDQDNKTFVVENFPKNKITLSEQSDINLVFENNVGLIAIRK